MSLIEHWVCENCDSVDPPTFNGDEKACGACAAEGENGLLVRLVPASQLRGAVKALELIASRYDWDASACPKIAHTALAEMGLLGPSAAGGR